MKDMQELGSQFGDFISEQLGIKKEDEKGVAEQLPLEAIRQQEILDQTNKVTETLNPIVLDVYEGESGALALGQKFGNVMSGVVSESSKAGFNMGVVKIGIMQSRLNEAEKEIGEDLSNYMDYKPIMQVHKEVEEAKEKTREKADKFAMEDYAEFVAAARNANTKRDLILDSIESAPLRFGASLIGGIVENTTDIVELAKMTGVNAISGGIGGAFGFAVDMGLGAWDNYMTANLESQVLYERDATQQERVFRAGVGAAAQLGMSATSKMIGKAVEGWKAHKGAMVEEANIRRSEALASLDPNVKVEVEPEITINVDPIAIVKAQTDAAYGVDGMTDILAKNNTLEVGGTVKFDVGNQPILPTSDENFVKFMANYNNKDIEVTMPKEIQTNPNMTSLEVQNLRAAKSTVTYEQSTKVDGAEVVETKNITGHNKRDAVLYATTTQPKMKNVINTVVPKAEVAGRINEKAYIDAYERGLITGDMTASQKLNKLDSQLSPTIDMDLKHTITDPLDKAYNSTEWEMTYKIGQALGDSNYGEFVFTRNAEGTLSKSFVTGDSTRVSSTTYDPFNQSMMRTHEILFANRAKADIIDSMLIENKYSNLIEMTPDGEVRLRSNTGTILDQGEVGLIDLYVNRNNAGVDVTNEYSRLGITEPGDVVEIINGFANTDRLNATAINEVIDKVLPEESKSVTRGLLEEVGILKRGEEGEFIATKEDLLNGFMELENRLIESTDKEPIEKALKLLYDKDNSPFKIRDKDGNVISGMSIRDLIVNNYKDTVASVRDIQKLNQPMQAHIQQAILGKVKQINEKVKDGFIRDMVDDVKVTDKVNKSLDRIQNTLKDLDVKDLDEKIGSKQFQNDLATLRELNEVYNFVDKDVLDLLDPKSYVDKEVYIAGQLEKGKVELNDSAAKTTEHIKATIEKSKEDFKTQSKELDNSKVTQIEEAKAKADQEIDDLKHEHELYKEYQEKAKEVAKTNKEFAKYEKEYGAWKEEVDMVEHVNAERTAKYESDMAEYNNRKAEWDQAEANRVEADNIKANEDFEKAVENRKAQVEAEYKRRYSKWENEKAKADSNSEEIYNENISKRNSEIEQKYQSEKAEYKKLADKYTKMANENKEVARENFILEEKYKKDLADWEKVSKEGVDVSKVQAQINQYPELYDYLPGDVKELINKPKKTRFTKAQAQAKYDAEVKNIEARNKKAMEEYNRYKDKDMVLTPKQEAEVEVVQDLVNKYPNLYDELSDKAKSVLSKPDAIDENVAKVEKLLESGDVLKTSGYKGTIKIDGKNVTIEIPSGVHKLKDMVSIVKKALPKDMADKATTKQLQAMTLKLSQPQAFGIGNIRGKSKIDPDIAKYITDKFGADTLDKIKKSPDPAKAMDELDNIKGILKKIEGYKLGEKPSEPKLEAIPEFDPAKYAPKEMGEIEAAMKMAEISDVFDLVHKSKDIEKPTEPKYKSLNEIKRPMPPDRDKIAESIPMPEQPTAKFDTPEPTMKDVEDLIPEPTKNTTEVARPFQEAEPLAPVMESVSKTEPVKPDGTPIELEPMQKPEPLKKGSDRIRKERVAKEAEIKAAYEKNISDLKAESASTQLAYKEMQENISEFVKDIEKQKDLVAWLNSDISLARLEGLDSMAKTLPDGELKLETQRVLDAIYEMADLKDSKLVDRKLANEYLGKALTEVQEKAKLVNKDMIAQKRADIKELKDLYRQMLKDIRTAKKSNPFTIYDEVDIDGYKAKFNELNTRLGGLFKDEKEFLPFRMIDTHKEILSNTKKSVDEGVVGKIDRAAQPKTLSADNAQMARLGAVINKQRHLADRAWYEFGNPSGVEGKLLKGQNLDNKYWKIRDIIGNDIKDITEVPEGTAAKIINPSFQERFAKLYDVAKTMFAEVKEGDTYRDINIDEFSVLYFKYLADLNQTKNVVGKWDGKKLNMGDLKPYFRDTDSMIGFLTLEDLDLQRVGYIKSNNDMLRYFHSGIAKNMAEYNTLGTTLGRFNSLMGLQSKNAKTTFKDALGTAGSDAAKEVHANVLDMAIEKLKIYDNKDPYISTNILNKPAWETAVDGARNLIMQSILTGVGTMELFTNPVTISKRYSELFGSKFNTYDLATDSVKGVYSSRGVYPKHFGKFGVEIYNLAAAMIQPMIQIGKFNQQHIADPSINRIKSGHKYVNAMLSKMQDADMFQRHMDMAKFTANNGNGFQGMGKRVMMAWNEMAFSMQKTPDLQKTLMAGEMAYKGMEDIRDLGGLDALSDSQVQLKNLLFSYGIRNEDDLIRLQTFLKNNTDKDGAIDLDFFDLATLQKNLDAEDMMDLNNAYGIFSSIFNHMDDYRDASKFKPRSHSYVDLMGSFLKNTVMDLGRHELQQTLYTLDDNGMYVNRLKNAWRKGDSTGGRISNVIGTSISNGLNIGGYLALLGTAGTAGLITQELIMKPLKVRETISRLVGEYDEMIEALDQDGQRELNDYVFGTLFFAMQQGATQYPAMVFASGGNFMNDMASSAYRIIESSIGNTEIENPQVKAALVAMGLDPDSIKYKASGGNYGDFRDYGVYQFGSMFGFRGFRGIIDGVMAIGESSAQTEVRLNKSLSRVQYQFQNSPKAKLAATAFFRDYGKVMSEIGDRINSTNAIIGESYIKTAQKAGLISEEEANAQMENVIKIEDIENKIEKLPEPVKEVAKGVPEFMGTESLVAKVETQKQIISAVTEGMSRKDVINATTGNKFNEYGVYKSKDPSQLTGTKADMYRDMQKDFNITDKDELLRIICVANSPKEAYGMIRDKFEVKGTAIPKIERAELLNTSMEFTLGEEGGAHVVNQVENSTWGVTEKVARAHGWYKDMKDIPKDFARMVYKKSYFEPVAKLSNNPAVVTILADAAYNQGLGFAQKIYKQFGDDPKALMQARVDRYNELVTKNPAKYGEFMNGWMNRLARLEKFIDSKGGSEQMLAGTTEQSIDGIAMSGMGGTAGYIQPQMEEVDSTMAETQTPEIDDIQLEDPQYTPKETAAPIEEMPKEEKPMLQEEETKPTEEVAPEEDKVEEAPVQKVEIPQPETERPDLIKAKSQGEFRDDMEKKLVSLLTNKPIEEGGFEVPKKDITVGELAAQNIGKNVGDSKDLPQIPPMEIKDTISSLMNEEVDEVKAKGIFDFIKEDTIPAASEKLKFVKQFANSKIEDIKEGFEFAKSMYSKIINGAEPTVNAKDISNDLSMQIAQKVIDAKVKSEITSKPILNHSNFVDMENKLNDLELEINDLAQNKGNIWDNFREDVKSSMGAKGGIYKEWAEDSDVFMKKYKPHSKARQAVAKEFVQVINSEKANPNSTIKHILSPVLDPNRTSEERISKAKSIQLGNTSSKKFVEQVSNGQISDDMIDILDYITKNSKYKWTVPTSGMYRDPEEQAKYFVKGTSKTVLGGNHLSGNALDIVPRDSKGNPDFNISHKDPRIKERDALIKRYIKETGKNIRIFHEYNNNWDVPHIELFNEKNDPTGDDFKMLISGMEIAKK